MSKKDSMSTHEYFDFIKDNLPKVETKHDEKRLQLFDLTAAPYSESAKPKDIDSGIQPYAYIADTGDLPYSREDSIQYLSQSVDVYRGRWTFRYGQFTGNKATTTDNFLSEIDHVSFFREDFPDLTEEGFIQQMITILTMGLTGQLYLLMSLGGNDNSPYGVQVLYQPDKNSKPHQLSGIVLPDRQDITGTSTKKFCNETLKPLLPVQNFILERTDKHNKPLYPERHADDPSAPALQAELNLPKALKQRATIKELQRIRLISSILFVAAMGGRYIIKSNVVLLAAFIVGVIYYFHVIGRRYFRLLLATIVPIIVLLATFVSTLGLGIFIYYLSGFQEKLQGTTAETVVYCTLGILSLVVGMTCYFVSSKKLGDRFAKQLIRDMA